MNQPMAPDVRNALLGRWEPVYRSQLHYLVTWSTRGRRPVLKTRHIEALRALIETTCEERGINLLEFFARDDRVQVLVGLRPAHSVASAIREMKGRAGVALLRDHPELRVWLRGNLMWDERYAVETVSSTRIEGIREKLRGHPPPEEDLRAAS